MSKYLTAFVTPENELFPMSYYQIEEFCKKECEKPENKDLFSKFKEDYTYYHPYFDFVMFELNYQMISPLLRKGTALVKHKDALYTVKISSLDYTDIKENTKEIKKEDLPCITRCTTRGLKIRKQTSDHIDHCMIDPNLIGAMTENFHRITSNTILNQLLIRSSKIVKGYEQYRLLDEDFEENMPINYLVCNLGFMRAAPSSENSIIILRKDLLEKEQKELIASCEKKNYHIYRVDETTPDLLQEYKKLIKI